VGTRLSTVGFQTVRKRRSISMPWIKQELCTGCGICIDECPVGAIKMEANNHAEIKERKCIRCGRCHDVCPQEAVRHDGERIDQEVAANLQWVQELLIHFQQPMEQAAFMERMVRFFNKQKKVSEKTLALIKTGITRPAEHLTAAIRDLSAENGK